jgi:hypothetical protein
MPSIPEKTPQKGLPNQLGGMYTLVSIAKPREKITFWIEATNHPQKYLVS